MFHPLAFTKTFAMVCSTILALRWCRFVHIPDSRQTAQRNANPIMRMLRAIYTRAALGLVTGSLHWAAVRYSRRSLHGNDDWLEFMRRSMKRRRFHAHHRPRISLTSNPHPSPAGPIISADPAVEMVVGKVGRAKQSTDLRRST